MQYMDSLHRVAHLHYTLASGVALCVPFCYWTFFSLMSPLLSHIWWFHSLHKTWVSILSPRCLDNFLPVFYQLDWNQRCSPGNQSCSSSQGSPWTTCAVCTFAWKMRSFEGHGLMNQSLLRISWKRSLENIPKWRISKVPSKPKWKP